MRSLKPLNPTRSLLAACLPALMLAADPALADPGHLAEAAGHNHWLAGAAIGAAVVIGAWAAIRGLWRPAAEAADPEPEADGADALGPEA